MPRAVPFERLLAELHAGALGSFAARRDALARTLRERGDPEGAKRMKSERKPSISAWSVTQVLGHHEDEVRALLAAGERARDALAAMLGGGGAPTTLRARMDELQARIDAARALAERHIAEETGRAASDVVLGRAGDDLRALALAADGAERVARGFLPEDLAPPGLELWSTVPAPPKRAPSRVAARSTSPTAQRADDARKAEVRRAEREERDADTKRAEVERELRAEEKKERAARERAQRAARGRAETLARDAERAEREACEARKRAEALAREADRAERDARDARQRADDAKRALDEA